MRGNATRRKRAVGRQCLVLSQIEKVIEGSGIGGKPDSDHSGQSEENRERHVHDRLSHVFAILMGSTPQDDKPQVGDAGECVCQSRELDGGNEMNEPWLHDWFGE